MIVCLSNVLSDARIILAGVPQGSVMGPILYNFYINDAPRVKQVDESDYADDKACLTSSFRISAIVNRLNQAAAKIQKFYNKWKIKINIQKSEAIIFTKRRPILDVNVCLNNYVIEWSSSVKYLGVILDSKRTFTKHINYAADKALKLLLKYYPLLNKKSNLSTINKLNIYKTIVRPAMLYASPVWSMTCNTNFSNLQIQQNKFLRLAGNYRRFTEINHIHNELKMEMIFEYVKRVTTKYFENITDHENFLMRNLVENYGKRKSIRYILSNI